MLRISWRFALIICTVCLLVFLSLYVLYNSAAPAANQKKQPFYMQFEAKLRRASKEQCVDVVRGVPNVDVQMLDLYDRMSFVDVDGGVWKQGWNVRYDDRKYNAHHKLKVFVVPHSHNDPGFLQTFDDYYQHDTKPILSNALRHLSENQDMKFIWAEISLFSRFFHDLSKNNKLLLRAIVKSGQLEFVTGGWVMPDEANSHWRNVLLQLTEGQTWLKKYLNVTPTASWAIDPYGHSPTLPYILQKSGFRDLLIQRTHYAVKKVLAEKRQLEFYWRQIWDTKGETSLFTHMMPFFSYTMRYTCGPDPNVCCQFDFQRMHNYDVQCPRRPITDLNVAARSDALVDQWKKKAELYRTNVLLIPLGGYFRYKQNAEWDVQRVNYEKLFDHINSHVQFNVQAQFGTLQEYFKGVHEAEAAGQAAFPTLSGDFFTYADQKDDYWSGYYTSRPYHKRMDRVLMHYVRSAEMLAAWNSWDATAGVEDRLELARRELSLFQHHDGITGTAYAHVVKDYEDRLLEALKACQAVMQQSVYRLLTKPSIYSPDFSFSYFTLDDSRWPGSGVEDSRTTIIIGPGLPTKHVVMHNTLPHWREQLVEFHVSSPFIKVSDMAGNPVEAQVSPVWTWHHDTLTKTILPQGSNTKFRIIFKARVPPMGLATYILTIVDSKPEHTSYASNLLMGTIKAPGTLSQYPEAVKLGERQTISLRVGTGPRLAFSENGLLTSIQLTPDSEHVPVHLSFLKYGTRSHDKSGTYRFLPNGPASLLVFNVPVVLVSEGKLESSVTVGLPSVVHQTILCSGAPEMRNLVDIRNLENTEIVMRLHTQIKSGSIFYTDLNGLQHIKRRRLEKLPLQANYYPVPSAMFIEDDNMRLTLLTGQPLGGSSLAPGELELMQDRRWQDDGRNVGDELLDNKPVLHMYRLLLEQIDGCDRPSDQHPAGYLTRAAHKASQSLLDPLDNFIFSDFEWVGAQAQFGGDHAAVQEDLDVTVMRRLTKTSAKTQRVGYVLHRTNLMQCGEVDQLPHEIDVCNMLPNTARCERTT
ncbi:hypothetical protein KR018_012006, partial [Drosophila ironensis]